MNPSQVIGVRRKELCLRPQDVAKMANIGVAAYRDLEWHEDEAYTAITLGNLRKVCKVLHLDILSIFYIENMTYQDDVLSAGIKSVLRSQLIMDVRNKLGLSRDELADRIGFDLVAIEKMEQDPDFLEGWPVQLIVELASILDIPIKILLDASRGSHPEE